MAVNTAAIIGSTIAAITHNQRINSCPEPRKINYPNYDPIDYKTISPKKEIQILEDLKYIFEQERW